jgi:predicted CXXCH cytochrome family protein
MAASGNYPGYRTKSTNEGPGVANHPVGIRPSAGIRIPAGWPLDTDGSLTCMTCHSHPPAGKDAAASLRGKGSSPQDPKAFCASCHQDSDSGTSVHWQAMPFAHVSAQHNRDDSARLSHVLGTQSCLSCHDGVSAGDASHNSIQSMGDFSERSRNHPVQVRYPRAGTSKTDVPLRPVSAVPESVSLAGGVVSCVSCHNLYSREPQRLSVPIEGSQLCFACHDLD